MRTGSNHWRDAVVTLVAAVLLLAWDFSGADLAVSRLFGSPNGFALRDNFWTATVAHSGGRVLAWACLLALIVCAWQKPVPAGGPQRSERVYWLMVTVVSLIAVPTIKQFSATSCPWDLALFGGQAQHVLHWRWGVADGGSGRCFPSGHAVGAFAFFSQYFLWRGYQPRRARRWLVAVLVVGTIFGLAQLARGAHYVSHSAWSALICFALSAVADAMRERWWRRRSEQSA